MAALSYLTAISENCPVQRYAICSALQSHNCNILSNMVVHKQFVRGQSIWRDEDDVVFFAIVISGVVKLTKMLSDGRQQIVDLFFSSDCLGQPFSAKHQTFAEAATDIELCCLPRQKFESVIKQYPELENAFLKNTLRDLDRARSRMLALGRKSASERIASFLLEISKKSRNAHGRNDSESTLPIFALPLTRSEIGDYLGLTVETVSRHISKLRSSGVIRLVEGQRIQVRDPNKLAQLACNN